MVERLSGRCLLAATGRKSFLWQRSLNFRPSKRWEAPKALRSSLKDYAATFDPEGGNGKVYWPYHRVLLDLLRQRHRQREELDHLTGCAVQAGRAKLAHVQPDTRVGKSHVRPHTRGQKGT